MEAFFGTHDKMILLIRYYVCDYGPGGNKVGETMYTPGPACAACPLGTSCGGQYPGLCSGSGSVFIENNSIDNIPDTRFLRRLVLPFLKNFQQIILERDN